MNNEVLERLKEEYGEDDDLIQLYEDWGNTPYLHEIYRILDEHSSDWVLERELGSWAAEFILGILQEHEEELEGMPETERVALFEEEIEERYADFKSCHQFARVNNLSMEKMRIPIVRRWTSILQRMGKRLVFLNINPC